MGCIVKRCPSGSGVVTGMSHTVCVCQQREDVGETPFPYHKIKDLLKDGDEVSVQLKVRDIMQVISRWWVGRLWVRGSSRHCRDRVDGRDDGHACG